jgi:hypothetical protein
MMNHLGRFCLFLGADGKAVALNTAQIEAVYAYQGKSPVPKTIILMTGGGEDAGHYQVQDDLAEVLAAISGHEKATLVDMLAFTEAKAAPKP